MGIFLNLYLSRFTLEKPPKRVETESKKMENEKTATAYFGFKKPNPDSIDQLDLGVRSKNVLGAGCVTSITELASMDPNRLQVMRNAGEVSFKEIGRALMKIHRTPTWLESVASGYRYTEAEVSQEGPLNSAGWNRVTSYYSRAEQWMLERAVADLERGHIEYKLVRSEEGGPVCIYRKGGIAMPDEIE